MNNTASPARQAQAGAVLQEPKNAAPLVSSPSFIYSEVGAGGQGRARRTQGQDLVLVLSRRVGSDLSPPLADLLVPELLLDHVALRRRRDHFVDLSSMRPCVRRQLGALVVRRKRTCVSLRPAACPAATGSVATL